MHRPPHHPTALVLTGGGARAAYQVGVLQALAQLHQAAGRPPADNPFPILVGTSAGAINAAALACGAARFDEAVAAIAQVWAQFRTEQVYNVASLSLLDVPTRTRMLWGLARLLTRWRREQPQSLLDNTPLAGLLAALVPLERLPVLLRAGHLQALAVTASSYSGGDHCTFYQSARPMQPWLRSQRRAMAGPLTHAHLLASSAIPFVFPATGVLHQAAAHQAAAHQGLSEPGVLEYFGDGSMRQSAPLSPAIHLGAERILAIGAGRLQEPSGATAPNLLNGRPSLAQIAGHALASIFLDALPVDVERLQRINHTLAQIPVDARPATGLRTVALLSISPSERLDQIAARHVGALPGVLHRALRADRPSPRADVQSSALASYLLFDAGFTQELMALGRRDGLARAEEIGRFMGWD